MQTQFAMDPAGKNVVCPNSAYGCEHVTSSKADNVRHSQSDCKFHPVRCFKCKKQVRRVNVTKQLTECCQDSPTVSHAGQQDDVTLEMKIHEELKSVREEQRFLQECVKECRLGIESFSCTLKKLEEMMEKHIVGLSAKIDGLTKEVPELANEVRLVKEKQAEVDATVKNSQAAHADLLTQLYGAVDALKKKQEDAITRVDQVSNTASNTHRRVNALAENVLELSQNIQAVKECYLNGAREINESVAAVPRLVSQQRWLRRLNGNQVFWYVGNISKHIEEGKQSLASIDSDVFVVRGYSAKMSLDVRQVRRTSDVRQTELWIGLYFRLCRGPNDSLLQWPFNIAYTLSLVHPSDTSKNKQWEGTPLSSWFPSCFVKPAIEENGPVGCTLCSVEAAQNEGLIENDAICISLALHE